MNLPVWDVWVIPKETWHVASSLVVFFNFSRRFSISVDAVFNTFVTSSFVLFNKSSFVCSVFSRLRYYWFSTGLKEVVLADPLLNWLLKSIMDFCNLSTRFCKLFRSVDTLATSLQEHDPSIARSVLVFPLQCSWSPNWTLYTHFPVKKLHPGVNCWPTT